MKGEPLGVQLLRKNPIKTKGSYEFEMNYVVLPAEDLLVAATQALGAKSEEANETKAAAEK